MNKARYSISRQKACQQCIKAKTRCTIRRELEREREQEREGGGRGEGCVRCVRRGLECVFHPVAVSRRRASYGHDNDEDDNNDDDDAASAGERSRRAEHRRGGGYGSSPTCQNSTRLSSTRLADQFDSGVGDDDLSGITYDPDGSTIASLPGSSAVYSFASHGRVSSPVGASHRGSESEAVSDASAMELVCPINARDISNRWLSAFAPLAGQTTKTYPANVSHFIYRMLKSYASTIVRGRDVPAFIHASKMASIEKSPQISACLSLVRMCAKPNPGAIDVVSGVLQNEMNKIYDQRGRCEAKALRDTFQAYLIYAMVLYFCLDCQSKSFLRQAMINMQELACVSSERGLVCTAEQQCVRPNWEAWVTVETQRRTLYLMYLFDNLLSTQDGVPTYLGTELRGLPAPSGKALWRAVTRKDWEHQYNVHLADWGTEYLSIDDLWPAPEGLNDVGLAKRRDRVDRWLEDVDEFGTMMYAVTGCTHGG